MSSETEFIPPITTAEVIGLFEKYDLRWVSEEYLSLAYERACACAAGACYIEQRGGPTQLAATMRAQYPDDDVIMQALGWTEPFLAGVTRGNDDLTPFNYGELAEQRQHQAGYQIGCEVRAHFLSLRGERDGDDDE